MHDPDATATWLRRRDALDWSGFPLLDPGGERDGHARFIEVEVAQRHPERVALQRQLLAQVRAEAAAGERLTFARMAEWHRAQGLPDAFRSGDAWAKAGRERYPLTSETQAGFERCVAEADGPLPLSARAVRLYLDVCFFHPFVDGNARAARFAFEFVLAREGVRPGSVEALFVLPRWAADARSPASMAAALHAACDLSRRRPSCSRT